MRSLARAIAVLPLLHLGACVASNPVDAADRAVSVEPTQLDWQPLRPGGLQGLYESVDIRGQAAGTLWKVYYVFETDGRYTGAALVAQDEGLRFQTIDGTWSVESSGLVLDGAAPVPAFAAADRVRIAAPTGELVLRRGKVQ